MAKLSHAQRSELSMSDFAIPERAPGPGSYPIPDRKHAADALARSSGKPEEKRVRAAVCRRYKDLPACQDDAEDRRDGGVDEASEQS